MRSRGTKRFWRLTGQSIGRLTSGGVVAIACAVAIAGCSGGDREGRVRTVDPVLADVTPVLRGTIGSETKLRRVLPTIVSGYGIVVDLDGTGGLTVPDRVAASIERELGLRGVGRAGTFKDTLLEGRSPRDVLRDPDVAVVIVEAAIPLAAPEGMAFDVRVRALPGSDTTSLEGGRLWTTRLQAGPPAVVGGPQTREVAVAAGEIFTNPFASATQGGPGDLDPRVGRVLAGGRMTRPLELELILANPLHSRARAMASAINQRFPDGPRGPGTVAQGVSDAVVSVRPPLEFRDRFIDFVELVRHLPIDPQFPEERARRYVRQLQNNPQRPRELIWALRSLGKPATPFVRELYDHPDTFVRMSGLTAGAYLDDPRAGTVLEEIARTPGPIRTDAIDMLGVVGGRPTIDRTLREIVETETELTLRIAAYEALAARALRARLTELLRDELLTEDIPDEQLAMLAERSFPPGMVQGIRRVSVGEKFLLDVMPYGEPLVYVTQQGRPRIAILGEDAAIERPSYLSVFEGDLLFRADPGDDAVLVRFNDEDSGRIVTDALGESLAEIASFLARDETPERPEPGLRMTYSEVVGTLFAIHNDGGTLAQFATENDRLLADLLAASTVREDTERAVNADDEELFNPDAFDPDAAERDIADREEDDGPGPYVVPLPPRPTTSG